MIHIRQPYCIHPADVGVLAMLPNLETLTVVRMDSNAVRHMAFERRMLHGCSTVQHLHLKGASCEAADAFELLDTFEAPKTIMLYDCRLDHSGHLVNGTAQAIVEYLAKGHHAASESLETLMFTMRNWRYRSALPLFDPRLLQNFKNLRHVSLSLQDLDYDRREQWANQLPKDVTLDANTFAKTLRDSLPADLETLQIVTTCDRLLAEVIVALEAALVEVIEASICPSLRVIDLTRVCDEDELERDLFADVKACGIRNGINVHTPQGPYAMPPDIPGVPRLFWGRDLHTHPTGNEP